MVHWVGVGSDVIICLAKSPRSNVPSSLYISYDYGDTFENKTEFFILSDSKKSYASLDKFYNHPTYINHVSFDLNWFSVFFFFLLSLMLFFLVFQLVFADVKNGVIFTTTDSGKTFNRIKLNFSPSDISFQVDEPFTFLAHDKIKPSREVR